MTNHSEHHNGWQWKSLESIAADGAPILYGILQPGPDTAGGVPYVRPTEINSDVIDLSSIRRTTGAIASKYKRSTLKRGDIILSIVGTIGKVALVPPELDGGNITQSSVRIRVKPEITSPRYVAWALRSPVLRRQFDQHRLGTAVPRLNVAHVRALRVPIAPLDEQQRIVAEIEKQFARLGAGVESLNSAQTALKRYRASVLKAACEGRLVPTEAELARKENRSYETGEGLLQRILKERREKWNGKGKYKEPLSPNAADLPRLSESWTWATLEQLFSELRNGWSYKPDSVAGIPILRISAVRPMSVNLADVRYLNGSIDQYADYILREGELLFTRYNGNPRLTGVCGVVPSLTEAIVYPDKLIRVRLVAGLCEPKFACMSANIGISRQFLASRARTTAGQTGISGSDLRQMPIPLPPLAEQTRIVAELERRLSVLDELEAVVATNLTRAARLRQTVLNKAFTGAPD